MSDRWVMGLVSEMLELPLPKDKAHGIVRRVRLDRFDGSPTGRSSHDITVTLHADGALTFVEDEGEGFIYLYADQVEYLRTFLAVKPNVQTTT